MNFLPESFNRPSFDLTYSAKMARPHDWIEQRHFLGFADGRSIISGRTLYNPRPACARPSNFPSDGPSRDEEHGINTDPIVIRMLLDLPGRPGLRAAAVC